MEDVVGVIPTGGKRHLHSPPSASATWNPTSWDWDPSRFLAIPKPGHPDPDPLLRLDLAPRPAKKARSGSPGVLCQVDDCHEDLSAAKDYHRRHKVCGPHSKCSQALVSRLLQRFCQQCSRFHPLPEFDEGKRSCRRRLAGHNRRRRKTTTLPDDHDVPSHLPQDRDPSALHILSLLASLAPSHNQGPPCAATDPPRVPDKEQLIQILGKMNSLPLPTNLAAKLSSIARSNVKTIPPDHSSGKDNPMPIALSSHSTADLLALLSQRSSRSCEGQKSSFTCSDQITSPSVQNKPAPEFLSGSSKTSSRCDLFPADDDSHSLIREERPSLALKLFGSSPDDDSPPKLSSSRKYFSSDSSNPIDERSPSSSPPIAKRLFPLQSMEETVTSQKMLGSEQANATVEGRRTLDLFVGSAMENMQGHSPKNKAGYTSSSGSDQSPSSQDSDSNDRTGRILFKLFDKDPSHLPGALRTQIYHWLSSSPSEMESYIRPGCVVLSVYLSMSSAAWKNLERNLHQLVSSLVHDTDSTLWRSGRFLLQTDRRIASHSNGQVRICRFRKSWSSPELISVSPLAVVAGQETSLLLRGRNLIKPGTKIHCTYMGGYISKEVAGPANWGNAYDEVKMDGLRIFGASTSVLGRSFIEVENGLKGNSLPLIIADDAICKELRLLESQLNEDLDKCDIIAEEQGLDRGQPRSRGEVIHFLHELGWLFQANAISPKLEACPFSLVRFKFLLLFSVERDYCALVRKILDMLVERNSDGVSLTKEATDMLSDIQLLHQSVKRRCRRMVDLLVGYHFTTGDSFQKDYMFSPNLVGSGGITPLHLAAGTSNSEDLIDALTNDPGQVGLSSWNSVLDANGQSPYAYAVMTSNYSYNTLVTRKIDDKRNSQISLTIGCEIDGNMSAITQRRKSCERCAIVSASYNHRVLRARGLPQRAFVHSLLAVAAVCVCVCLFFRNMDQQLTWESLGYGTI